MGIPALTQSLRVPGGKYGKVERGERQRQSYQKGAEMEEQRGEESEETSLQRITAVSLQPFPFGSQGGFQCPLSG